MRYDLLSRSSIKLITQIPDYAEKKKPLIERYFIAKQGIPGYDQL